MDGYLRSVTVDDAEQLYIWRNEALVRENSFQTAMIFYEDHQNWLNTILEDKTVIFCILMVDASAIGQVRLKIDDKMGIVSYSIGQEYRSKGYGKLILKLLEDRLRNLGLEANLVGYVKKGNIASQRVFESLGYKQYLENDAYKYVKFCSKHEFI